MIIAQQVLGGPRRKLWIACQELGLDLSARQAHTAGDDAAATALLYVALRSRHRPTGVRSLARGSLISLAAYQEAERFYNDDDLQAAWELFEEKDYNAALTRAMAAVIHNEAHAESTPDGLSYELACMILRRRSRLPEDKTYSGDTFAERSTPMLRPLRSSGWQFRLGRLVVFIWQKRN